VPSGKNQGVAAGKRDYYDVLGVSRDADEAAIKHAFHSLVREWHPDVAEGPGAETRFRELAEAYSVLSRRERRLMYDRYGYRGKGSQEVRDVAWDEPLADVRRGENVHLDLELKSYEADRGGRPVVTFRADRLCADCLGSGRDPAGDDGNGQASPCNRCNGSGVVDAERRLRVLLPPRLEDGAQVRVAGEGADAGADSIPGDLLIQVHILPSPKDRRGVRYLSFALLVVAVVVLIVYVAR
jgi:DnaJ-class molecular chaperone